MRSTSIALAGAFAIIAGCSNGRTDAVPVQSAGKATATVSLPIDLLGTWTDRAGGGFIAFGNRQIVIAVDGSPRAIGAPVENAIEPGMTAGKIGIAGGTAIFLSRGSAPVNGAPVEYIDAEIIAADGATVRRRMFAESGLRMAAQLAPAAPLVATAPASAQPTVPVPAILTAPVAAMAVVAPSPEAPAMAVDPDASFLAAVPASRRGFAEQQVAAARSGAAPAELATGFGNRQRTSYGAILTLVEQSRNLPAEQRAARLAEADLRRSEAESFAQAWRAWMAGRG